MGGGERERQPAREERREREREMDRQRETKRDVDTERVSSSKDGMLSDILHPHITQRVFVRDRNGYGATQPVRCIARHVPACLNRPDTARWGPLRQSTHEGLQAAQKPICERFKIRYAISPQA